MEACSKMLRVTTRILACGTERLVLPFTNREDMKKQGVWRGEGKGSGGRDERSGRETEMGKIIVNTVFILCCIFSKYSFEQCTGSCEVFKNQYQLSKDMTVTTEI